jgi:hypothetical protein
MAPSYANIFMGKLEKLIIQLRSKVEIDEFGYFVVGYPFAETMGLPGLLTL